MNLNNNGFSELYLYVPSDKTWEFKKHCTDYKSYIVFLEETKEIYVNGKRFRKICKEQNIMGRLGYEQEEIETPMSEQEKTDFVSGKFLYAITDFSLFTRGEAYWLEYIGNDTYCCRSDNLLNEKIRIKQWELKRYFSEEPLHSFENILSEFAYFVRTWGLTDGESNEDFCNVEAHRCAKEMIKGARKRK